MKRTEGTVLRVVGNRLIALVSQTKAYWTPLLLKMGMKANLFAKNGSIYKFGPTKVSELMPSFMKWNPTTLTLWLCTL
jgi:hypothetical protein